MSLDTRDTIAVCSSVIAISSAIASGYLALRGQRRQYFSEMRKWADEACDRLSDCVHLCDLDPQRMGVDQFFAARHSLRCALSSLIDRGRWFFPNLLREEVGVEKGMRQPMLNCLVQAYIILSKMDFKSKVANDRLRESLVEAKRAFVSQVQSNLDPRHRRAVFAKLTAFTGRDGAEGLAKRTP